MATHTVQSGDSISSIAAHYGVDWRELAAANGIPITKRNGKDFALIKPGQNLDVPPSGDKTVAAPPPPPTPPLPTPKPTPPKAKEEAHPVLYRSEYDQMVKNDPKSVPLDPVIIPDPPKPVIKTDPPPPDHPNSDQFPPAVEGQINPWKQALDDADPVKVLSQVGRPGGSADPDWTDKLNVASLAAGPEGEEAAALLERPMAGEARLGADNSVSRGATPRSLVDNRFTRMHPQSMGETPVRSEPRMGKGPRSPVTVDPVSGKFRAGRSLELPADQSSMGVDSPYMRREPIADPSPMSVIGDPEFSRGGYAMGGSPFQLRSPGLPVQDVGDVVKGPWTLPNEVNRGLDLAQPIMPSMGNVPPGGSSPRVGSKAWNTQYEMQHGLKPGSLVESNAGRGDVVKMPPSDAEIAKMTDDNIRDMLASMSGKQAGQAARNSDRLLKEPFYNEKDKYFRDPDAYAQWQKESNAEFNPGPPMRSEFELAADRAKLHGVPQPSAQDVLNGWKPPSIMSDKTRDKLLGNQPSPSDSAQTDFDPDAIKASGGRIRGYAIGGNPQAFVERAASYGLRHEGFLNSGVAGRTDHIGLQVKNGSYVIPADVVSAAGQGNSLAGAGAFDKLLKQGPYGASMGGIRAPRAQMPGNMSGNMKMSSSFTKMSGPRGGGSMRMPTIATGGPVPDTSNEADPNTTTMKKGGARPNVLNDDSLANKNPVVLKTRGYELATGGQAKKPRELVAPKANWNASSGGARVNGPSHHIPILAAGGEYIISPETVARIGGGDQQKGFRILDKLVLMTRKKHIKTLQKLKPPKKK